MQTINHVQKIGNEVDPTQFAWWFANCGKVLPFVEQSPDFFTNPLVSPYNPYSRPSNPLSKCRGDITSHDTVTYSYDDLNRLITATASVATSSPYTYTYSYSPIGNISSSTPSGAYTYAGTNYANPHAATQIGGVTQSYDDNGNLTSDEAYTYSWDYHNRLTDSTANDNISHYLYDHDNRRVQMEVNEGEGTTTTKYWNKYYSTKDNTLTRYIFAGDTLLATIEGEGTATSTYCNHPDHLGGANVTTDESGNLSELDTYYPFGAIRQSEKEGSFDQKRKAIGQYYDEATALNYYNARYMNGAQGRFLSQDPSFLAVGSPTLKDKTKLNLPQYLSNPQQLNSYSYANNNPIINKDSMGEFVVPAALVIAVGVSMSSSFIEQYGSDILSNYNNGVRGINILSSASGGEAYALNVGVFGLVGGLVKNPIAAGSLAVGVSVADDLRKNQQINAQKAAIAGGITAASSVFLKVTNIPDVAKITSPKITANQARGTILGATLQTALYLVAQIKQAEQNIKQLTTQLKEQKQ